MLVLRASGVLWEKPHEDHPSTNNQIQVAFLSLEKGACLLEWSWCGDFYINSTPKHHVQGNCVAEFSVPSPSSLSRWMRNTIIVYNLMSHKVLMLILSYGVHYKTCYFTTFHMEAIFLACGSWGIAHRSWFIAHRSWGVACGRWVIACGSWGIAHRSWGIAHGSWGIAHGSWGIAHRNLGIACWSWGIAHGSWGIACGIWGIAVACPLSC